MSANGRREMEHHLRALGASKREATGAATAVPEHVAERVAPWLRIAARWQRLDATVRRLAWTIAAWMR